MASIEEQLQTLTETVERLEKKAIDSHIQLELKNKLDEQIKALKKMSEPRPRDSWEKFTMLSGFLSSLLIAIVGGAFTFIYNANESARNEYTKNRELIISETDAVHKLIPSLSGSDTLARKIALLSIASLNNIDLATRLAPQFYSIGGIEALEDLLGRATKKEDKLRIKKALSIAYESRGTFYFPTSILSAIEDYKKATSYDSTNLAALYSKAYTYAAYGNSDSTKTDIEKYYNYTKDDFAYNYVLGVLAYNTDDFLNAIKSFDTAISIESFTADAYIFRAHASYYQFMNSKEERYLDKAISDRKRAEKIGTAHLSWKDYSEIGKLINDEKSKLDVAKRKKTRV